MKKWSNIGAEHFDNDKYILIVSQEDGWNVYLDFIDYCFYLYNFNSNIKSQLPRVKKKIHDFSKCIVFCDSNHPYPIVTLVYNQFKTQMHCTCDVDEQWHERTLLYVHPGDEEDDYYGDIFCDVVIFNGIFYGINRDCEIIKIHVEERAGSLCLEFKFNVFFGLPPTWFETARFVVSCSELFVVVIPTNIKIVVFKLDVLNSRFIPIYNLGDQVFFIKGNYSTSFSGEKVGHTGNCVCFIDEGTELLYLMNFKDGTLSCKKVHGFNKSFSEGLLLFYDVLRTSNLLDSSSRTTNREEGKEDCEKESLIMLKIPLHLQERVAKLVNKGPDYLNLRSVCTTWRSMTPVRQWKSCFSTRYVFECPWLMSNKRDDPTCKLSDPRDNATYLMSDPELSDCVVRYSRDGWLLVTKGCTTMFLYEPFAKKKIDLPEMDRNYYYNGICLSDNPSSSKLSIFGFYHVYPIWMTIIYLNPGDRSWTYRDYDHRGETFTPSYCNPVFSNGAFYCLSQEGKLGVFKLKELTWEIFSISTPLVSLPPTTKLIPSFIISYHQDLYLVYVSDVAGEFVKVYKSMNILSDGEGEWKEVTRLGYLTLFVSEAACFGLVAPNESMRNLIYFPCFSLINSKQVFYSLESGTYRTFGGDGGDISTKRLYDTKVQLHNSTWIQPRLVPSSW